MLVFGPYVQFRGRFRMIFRSMAVTLIIICFYLYKQSSLLAFASKIPTANRLIPFYGEKTIKK